MTELATTLTHLPAGLGGVGVESVAQRADATFYSSFLTSHFRMQGLGMGGLGAGFDSQRATKENRPFLCGPGFGFVGSSICGGPQIFVG